MKVLKLITLLNRLVGEGKGSWDIYIRPPNMEHPLAAVMDDSNWSLEPISAASDESDGFVILYLEEEENA